MKRDAKQPINKLASIWFHLPASLMKLYTIHIRTTTFIKGIENQTKFILIQKRKQNKKE